MPATMGASFILPTSMYQGQRMCDAIFSCEIGNTLLLIKLLRPASLLDRNMELHYLSLISCCPVTIPCKADYADWYCTTNDMAAPNGGVSAPSVGKVLIVRLKGIFSIGWRKLALTRMIKTKKN